MKVAIMQPYLFPYIGYFQMVNDVDKFVFLDDVNFITRGWINRNRIISSNGSEVFFTVPLSKASQNKLINEVEVSQDFRLWRKKFLKTLTHSYGKRPFFRDICEIVERTLSVDSEKISDIACRSVIEISRYLGINTEFLYSSDLGCAGIREEKIVNICNHLGADGYVNAIGGKALYNKEQFHSRGIDLEFIRSNDPLSYMSILHVIMEMNEYIDLEDFTLE
jgi:hypothetical protein